MVNKVSWSHNYASFKKLWKIFCTYVTYFWLKRRRICRRIYFMYHLYIKNWKQKTFGNNYYPLFTSPHIIAQFPPPGVVTDPSGRTSADKYLGHLLLPYLWRETRQREQIWGKQDKRPKDGFFGPPRLNSVILFHEACSFFIFRQLQWIIGVIKFQSLYYNIRTFWQLYLGMWIIAFFDFQGFNFCSRKWHFYCVVVTPR